MTFRTRHLWTMVAVLSACSLTPTGPIALDDRASVVVGEVAQIDVLRNDRHGPNETLEITAASADSGTVTVDGAVLVYEAIALGSDLISYTISSPSGSSDGVVAVAVLEPVDSDVDAEPPTGDGGSDAGGGADDDPSEVEEPDDPPEVEEPDDPPEVSIGFIERRLDPDRMIVSVEATDERSVESVSVESGGDIQLCASEQCEVAFETPDADSFTVTATASDDGGNRSVVSETVVVDREGPVIGELTVVGPTVSGVAVPVTVTVDAHDPSGLDSVEILFGGKLVQRCPISPCSASLGSTLSAAGVAVVAADVWGNSSTRTDFTQPRPLPDLVVRDIELISDDLDVGYTSPLVWRLIQLDVTIGNVGSVASGPFGLTVDDQDGRLPTLVAVTATTAETVWVPAVESLAPGESRVITLDVAYSRPKLGDQTITVNLDSCAGRDPVPPGCDVVESDEDNNSRSIVVELPGLDVFPPLPPFPPPEPPEIAP